MRDCRPLQTNLLTHRKIADWEQFEYRWSPMHDQGIVSRKEDARQNRIRKSRKLKNATPAIDPIVAEIVCSHLGMVSGHAHYQVHKSLLSVGLSLDSLNVVTRPMQGLSVLDIYCGSAITANGWNDEYSPYFARVATFLGANVLGLDRRPQLETEIFKWKEMDLWRLRELHQICADYGKFDLIHAQGVISPEYVSHRKWNRRLMACLVGHVRPGGIINLDQRVTYF